MAAGLHEATDRETKKARRLAAQTAGGYTPTVETEMTEEQRARRLELARKAFHDFKAQCFWWVRDDLEINEAALPTIIEGLRLHGGHQGYRIVVELCR